MGSALQPSIDSILILFFYIFRLVVRSDRTRNGNMEEKLKKNVVRVEDKNQLDTQVKTNNFPDEIRNLK